MRKNFRVGDLLSRRKDIFSTHFAFFGLAKLTISCWFIAAGIAFAGKEYIVAMIFLGVASLLFVVYDFYIIEYVKEKELNGSRRKEDTLYEL